MLDDINFILIREIISSILILTGVIFMFISTLGLLRLPDFYIRMSAITKGATLGVGLILSGMGIYFNEADMLFKVFIIIVFTFLTAPIAAHVIARTAVHNKVRFWRNSDLEEFQEYLEEEQISSEKEGDEKVN
jgi:multicomponent Na+:H+ antiporter subunit G